MMALIHASSSAQSQRPSATPYSDFTYGSAAKYSGIAWTYPGGPNLSEIPIAIEFLNFEVGRWLTIRRYNDRSSSAGFHPCSTEMKSNYQPLVTRNADGTYTIEFVGEVINK